MCFAKQGDKILCSPEGSHFASQNKEDIMSIKKYRLCLCMVLVVVVLVGAIIMMKNTEDDNAYKDGIMVYKEGFYDGEEYL